MRKNGAEKKDSKPEILRAESRGCYAREPFSGLPTLPVDEALHELRVYQIELEMQNDELRRTQLALEQSRDRYVDLYEFAPIGYLSLTREGMIAEVNLTGAALLGMERNKLMQRRFDGFVAAADKDRWQSHCLNVLRRVERKVCELLIRRGDDTCFYAQLDCQKIGNDDCPMVRIALTDISERKQAEEQLHWAEESLRLMGESVIDHSIIMLDTRGCVVGWNKGAQRIKGYTADEIIGQHFSRFYHPEDIARGKPQSDMDRVLAEGRLEDESWRVRKGGATFWANVIFTAIRDEHGNLRGFANLTRDLTERTAMEQRLIDQNVDLESAKSAAEKANRAKSEFISSMSHELRTPLNAILGFTQLLEASSPPPSVTQAARVQQIAKAGWYLLELINEILDLAVIESGKMALSPEPVSMAEILHECQAMIGPQAHKFGIQICFPPFDHGLFVHADKTRLKQVVINLLSNAIKYNREHGTVEVQCAASSPGRVRISVKDSGVGLSPEMQEQLFQPFNRLGQEKGSVEGTGIGLVVTKQLVDLMGGSISVESMPGAGSEFRIELGCADMPQSGAEIAIPAAAEPLSRICENTTRHTLLYVEDNPANLMLVEQIIEGHSCLGMMGARDGKHGIELARAELPDIILMDINLPGISGLETLNLLRADPATARIPVIALSANAMPGDIADGLQAGFFRYLTKPIKIDECLDALEMALEFAANQPH